MGCSPTYKAGGKAWLAVGCFSAQLVGSGVMGGVRVAQPFCVFYRFSVLWWLPYSLQPHQGARMESDYAEGTFLLSYFPTLRNKDFSIGIPALQCNI